MRETILILIISQVYLIEFVGEMVKKNYKEKANKNFMGFFFVAKFSEEVMENGKYKRNTVFDFS